MENEPSQVPLQSHRRAFSLFDEFKAFVFRGNVIDLAVAVIIGTAFAKIVDSLVKNVMMPLISLMMPTEQGYTAWKWVINGKEIAYGLFLGDVANFLIVALAVFIFIVKFLGWMLRTKQTAPPPPTRDQQLLMEIRDLLQQRSA